MLSLYLLHLRQNGKAVKSKRRVHVQETHNAGLEITVAQRTMSGQNSNVTSQRLHSPVMLTGISYSHS